MAGPLKTRKEAKREGARQVTEARRELVACCATGNWSGAAMFALDCGLSELMPALLYDAWQQGRITADELPSAMQEVWVHNCRPVLPVGERAWVRMFKASGFFFGSVQVIRNDERIVPAFEHLEAQPTEPLTIWRGAGLAHAGRGMSWTAHRNCAVHFAERYAAYRGDQGVWKATVPPVAVLALFGDEREQEVVIDPNMLRGRVSLDERIAEKIDEGRRGQVQRVISGA
jgi:hypothetical protein